MHIFIFGSGKGSNARAILDSEKRGELGNAIVDSVISDKNAPILSIGKEYGKNVHFLEASKKGAFFTEEEITLYKDFFQSHIKSKGKFLCVLAGFMKIIPPELIEAFEGRIINLHPSLLPAFKGKDGIKDAFEYGVKYTGCSVHWVSEEVDDGAIIDQVVVSIEDNDTEESLRGKIHREEHLLLSKVIKKLSLEG